MNLYSHERTRKLEEERLNALLAIEATLGRPPRRPSTLKVEPGKDEEFRYLRRSLLASEQVDRLIAATEPAPERQRVTAPEVAPVAPPRRKSIFGPVAERAGRALRRLGEGLESWADSATADPECRPTSFDQP